MSFWQQSSDIFARFEEDKISRDARLLHFEGTGHAAQSQKDGLISVRLSRICDHPDPESLAAELESIGLWERTEDGWLITDYLNNNRASDEVQRSKELARQRTERSRRHKQGDHSQCTKSRFCPDGELDPSPRVTRDITRDTTRDVTPSYLNSPHLTVREGESEERSVEVESDGPTGLAPVGPASSAQKDTPSPQVTVHAFYDSTFTGLCDFCGLKKSNAMHQSELPEKVLRLAEVIAEQGAWSNITASKYDGWREWCLDFTAPTFTGYLSTALAPSDEVGHVSGVTITLPMAQPVATATDAEDQSEWISFNQRVAAIVESFAPGAVDTNNDDVSWEDGELSMYLGYPYSNDRQQQAENDKKARKYLLQAFRELTAPYVLQRIHACAQSEVAA